MNKAIQWFRKRFKTVYCDECKHRSKDTWFGKHDCLVSPLSFTERIGSKTKRPKIKKYSGYYHCETVKHFSWCRKYEEE